MYLKSLLINIFDIFLMINEMRMTQNLFSKFDYILIKFRLILYVNLCSIQAMKAFFFVKARFLITYVVKLKDLQVIHKI